MEKILFDKVSAFAQLPHTYKKVVKNLSFEISKKEIFSIVSQSKYENNIIEKILLKDIKISNGRIDFFGKSFDDCFKVKDSIDVISKKVFENFSPLQSSLNFIIGNNDNEYILYKEYENNIFSLEQKLNKTNKKIERLSSRENYFNNIYDKKISMYKKYIEKNNDYVLRQETIFEEKNKLNSEIKNLLIKKEKLIDGHSLSLRDIVISSKKSINLKRENTNEKFIFLKDMLKKEKEEMSKRVNKVHSKDHHNELVYNRLKKQTKRFAEMALAFSFEGIELNKEFKKHFQLFTEIDDKKIFFENFDLLIEKMDLLIGVLGDRYTHKLTEWKAFLLNIEADASAINTNIFNEVNDWILEDIKSDIDFHNLAIEDIEKQLVIIDKNDKKEKAHLLRETWELKRMSLRYQKQILKEKLEVILENKNSIIEASLLHSHENFNDFYHSIKDYKKQILLIDVAFILWKKKQKIKALKLNLKQHIQIIDNSIKKKKDTISELNKSLDSNKEYTLIKDSYLNSFSLDIHKKMQEKINNTTIEEFEQSVSNTRKSLIIEKNNLIKEIVKAKNEKKTLKIELELKVLDLFDEVNLNASYAAKTFSELTFEEKQKVNLIKTILKGKKLVIFNSPDFKESSDIKTILDSFKVKYDMSFLIFTNDIFEAKNISDYVLVIKDGVLCEKNKASKIINEAIHPYTKDMYKNFKKVKLKDEKDKANNKKTSLLRTPYSVLDIRNINNHHFIYSTEEELKKWR